MFHKLFAFVVSAAVSWPGGRYVDQTRTFELYVPAGYRVSTGPDKPSDSYIPACSPESSVCFQYPPGRYKGSDFESASVEVTIVGASSHDPCVSPFQAGDPAADRIEPNNPTETIDGLPYVHYSGGGAAAGHESGFDRYRGFDRGTCFVLSAELSYSGGGNPHTRKFSPKDQKQVMAELNSIIKSFRALRKSSPSR
jgi:hypothetical protein